MSADYLTAGAQERARGARAAATCAAPSCWSEAERVRVGDREAVLCDTHRLLYRAHGSGDVPPKSGEGSQASQGKEQAREEKNRTKAVGDLRDLRLLRVFTPLPPKIEGGEGGRACVGYSDPEISGGVRR